MYGCGAELRGIPAWGMPCGIGGAVLWDSSGESTADSPSAPLESAGSGALRQAWRDVSYVT